MKDWLLKVAIKKTAYGVAKAAAGLLAYSQVQSVFQALGIQVDPTKFEAGVALFVVGGLEMIHDWAKLKFPNSKYL